MARRALLQHHSLLPELSVIQRARHSSRRATFASKWCAISALISARSLDRVHFSPGASQGHARFVCARVLLSMHPPVGHYGRERELSTKVFDAIQRSANHVSLRARSQTCPMCKRQFRRIVEVVVSALSDDSSRSPAPKRRREVIVSDRRQVLLLLWRGAREGSCFDASRATHLRHTLRRRSTRGVDRSLWIVPPARPRSPAPHRPVARFRRAAHHGARGRLCERWERRRRRR